ncbi:hypothetical protein ZWY2020_034210 [Hordeum vulgare]|nr:hypothetical protein ZWY2020_034210 [Hordeum vulgare]
MWICLSILPPSSASSKHFSASGSSVSMPPPPPKTLSTSHAATFPTIASSMPTSASLHNHPRRATSAFLAMLAGRANGHIVPSILVFASASTSHHALHAQCLRCGLTTDRFIVCSPVTLWRAGPSRV